MDKPAGLPCHPLKPEETDSVVQAVLARFPEQARFAEQAPRELGLLHRLDNQTSGVLLFAKHRESKSALQKLQSAGGLKKTYLAWVQGKPPASGIFFDPIAHHPKSAKRMFIPQNERAALEHRARPARTDFRVVETRGDFSLLEIQITKGLRHQIRIHFAHHGHPIVGDALYGGVSLDGLAPGRHLLHAWRVEFQRPGNGERVKIEAGPALDFSGF